MSLRVLIVEDNADNTKLLTRVLTANGMHVEAVETAEDALARLAPDGFDCILMDVLLPGMDGKEATRRLRADPRFRGLPIIAVTAQAIEGERQAIVETGVSAIVTKPIDFDVLLDHLRALVPAGGARGDADGADAPPRRPRTGATVPDDPGGRHAGAAILVVEDDAASAALLARLLGEAGLDAETVDSAEAGLRRLEARRFDLVLMDVALPGIDGTEAVRRLRADPRFRDLPIIAVSAHVIGEQLAAILDSGVSALVSKPIDTDELFHAIDALLPQREARA